MTTPETIYKMMVIDTSEIEVPREKYQRDFNDPRTKRIVKDFDERIANEPKLSFRDNKYYVFDGQHTIAARKLINGGHNLPVLCKVYFGMTAEKEALLFAKQTGESAPVTARARIRAEVMRWEQNLQATRNISIRYIKSITETINEIRFP